MLKEVVLKQLESIQHGGGVIAVTGTKFNLKCSKHDHAWGVYLDSFGNLPHGWDVCILCSKEQEAKVKQYFIGRENVK